MCRDDCTGHYHSEGIQTVVLKCWMLGEERCRISRLELDVSHWHFVQTIGEHDLVARLIIFLHLYSLSHNFSFFFLKYVFGYNGS